MWTPIPINLYVHIPYCVKSVGFATINHFLLQTLRFRMSI